ncbi:MAG: ABC transporter permease, partial [Anaerovorax sp.]
MLLFENIKLALTAIKSNKMRSFLTMLGIIIGISSVIAITSIGDSAKAVLNKEYDSFGKNYFIVYLNWEMTGDYVETSDMIMPEEIEAVKARFPNEVGYIAPMLSANTETTVGRVKGKLSISGVAGGYTNYKKMNILHGRMINETDVNSGRDGIVIDKEAALHFFNKENAIGERMPATINGEVRDLVVVGVYEIEKSIFSSMGGNGSYAAYVPYSILETGDGSTTYLDMYGKEGTDVDLVGGKVTSYLEKIKDKPKGYYKVETVQAQQGMMDQMLGTLSLAIGAIAAISLVVGGIGIMNIMLVSVTERTREIGIRKSLGARTRDILQQFLIEAMIISAIGGLMGTGLGIGIAAIGMSFAKVAVIINPMVIVMAVVFSAMVGMFFGLYPARKAAKLDPIEA